MSRSARSTVARLPIQALFSGMESGFGQQQRLGSTYI
jgi:hypothetical protein